MILSRSFFSVFFNEYEKDLLLISIGYIRRTANFVLKGRLLVSCHLVPLYHVCVRRTCYFGKLNVDIGMLGDDIALEE